MNSEDKPVPEQRSTFLRFGRGLFTGKNLRRGALVLFWFVTLVALFYVEEDWRGRRAWHQYEQRRAAQGTPLGLAPLIPKPVPDDQNFAMSPSLVSLFDFVPGTQHFRDTNGLAKIQNEPPKYKEASQSVHPEEKREGDWARGLSIDLQAWQKGFDPMAPTTVVVAAEDRATAAKGVLLGLQEWTPLLNEMSAASQRPYSRFNIKYDEENTAGILLPHLSVLKRMVDALKLRASAEVAIGETGRALNDIDLAFKIADAVKDEPILISFLVRMSEIRLILQPIWEGMAAQKWSDAQLKDLQQHLTALDILADGKRALEDDRTALGNTCIEFVRKSPSKRADMIGLFDSVNTGTGYSPLAPVLLQLTPGGWFYLEQLEYNQIYDRCITPLIDTTNHLVSPELSAKTQTQLEQLLTGDPLTLLWEHRMFARLLVPAVSGLTLKIARTQDFVDLGVTACALERYRKAKGSYPDTLTQVVPDFLSKIPTDVIDGKPLSYRPEGGRFVLYSIGWDGKDDGGEYPSKHGPEDIGKRGLGQERSQQGDWVWRYPSS